jgi:hypothetical protein
VADRDDGEISIWRLLGSRDRKADDDDDDGRARLDCTT